MRITGKSKLICLLGMFCTAPACLAASDVSSPDTSNAVQTTKLAFSLFGGYQASSEINKGINAGFEFLVKDVDFNNLQVPGDWEAGIFNTYTFSQFNRNSDFLIYAGHGIADENRFAAGLVAGVLSYSDDPHGPFLNGQSIAFSSGIRASYEINVMQYFYIKPVVTATYNSLTTLPFTYSGMIGFSYTFPYYFRHR